MKFWSVKYKGTSIRVEREPTEWRLIVDGELQDAVHPEHGRLTGVIRSGAGAGEQIKASCTGGFLGRFGRCYIFVDHKLVQ